MLIQNIKEITKEQAMNAGINFDTIKVCETIRKLAKLDRLCFEDLDRDHRSGLNKHLLGYLQYCGVDPHEYIRNYFSHLQPYMLERRKDQELKNTFVCVIDKLYRVSIYIKVDKTQYQEAVISFHEDNKRGIAKSNVLAKNNSNNLVPVFAESIGSYNDQTGKCSINLIMQRGLKELPLSVIGVKCGNVFIVKEQDISNQFLDYCNEYIRDLYTSDLNLDFDKIDVFSMLQQISFTSYGKDLFSSISLLIDSLVIQKDAISKEAADFALLTFSQNTKLTVEQANELCNLLEEKFKVSSIKNIDSILRRVEHSIKGEEEESVVEIIINSNAKKEDKKIETDDIYLIDNLQNEVEQNESEWNADLD